jgi:ribosomal protein S18 acetylase RimI-like enzyme
VADFSVRDVLICKANPGEMPWALLLDADPARSRVESYLSDEFTRIAKYTDEVIGVYALSRLSLTRFELMNIAVRDDYQGKGLGRWLLGHAIGVAESKGARVIEVGTGNSSLENLAFYQRSGFRITGVIRDHFVDNYPEPIVEDGIVCRDMVRLTLELTPE